MPAIAHQNKILGNTDTLNDLSDVNIQSPSQGQVMTYQNGAWENANPTGGVTSFNGRTGAVVPTDGDYTKSQVGLGNVPNVTTNNQTPTFTQTSTRTNIVSGETLTTLFGKIMKWFADLKNGAFLDNTVSAAVSCAVGATSATINNSNIKTTSIVIPYAQTSSNKPIPYNTVTVTAGTAVIAFDALTEAASIRVEIINP